MSPVSNVCILYKQPLYLSTVHLYQCLDLNSSRYILIMMNMLSELSTSYGT